MGFVPGDGAAGCHADRHGFLHLAAVPVLHSAVRAGHPRRVGAHLERGQPRGPVPDVPDGAQVDLRTFLCRDGVSYPLEMRDEHIGMGARKPTACSIHFFRLFVCCAAVSTFLR